jgi:pimeloyl-[acyl-carrier protein] methyl ester esterase
LSPRLVFAHGWGMDRSLWDAVLIELGDLAGGAIILDSGYYGAPAAAGELEGEELLGVGHSLGALELMTAPPAPLSGLVAIDAFARFTAAPDFPEGQDARALRSVIRQLDRASPELVAEVVARTFKGQSCPPGEPCREALAIGLERLIALDGRAAVLDLPLWRLHADDDPAVPLALSDASFAACPMLERRVRAGADHLSPVTAPELCADLIRSAIEEINREDADEAASMALAFGIGSLA